MQTGQTSTDVAPLWLEAGPLRMEHLSRRVTVRGRELALTDMETGVLRLLMLHQGTPLGRAAILERLYPGAAPEARVVDVFICRLRAKLGQAGLYCVIGTVWRRGYLLQVSRPERPWDRPVERIAAPPLRHMPVLAQDGTAQGGPAQGRPGLRPQLLRLA